MVLPGLSSDGVDVQLCIVNQLAITHSPISSCQGDWVTPTPRLHRDKLAILPWLWSPTCSHHQPPGESGAGIEGFSLICCLRSLQAAFSRSYFHSSSFLAIRLLFSWQMLNVFVLPLQMPCRPWLRHLLGFHPSMSSPQPSWSAMQSSREQSLHSPSDQGSLSQSPSKRLSSQNQGLNCYI